MNLPDPVNDGTKRRAYKNFRIKTQKSRLAKEGVVANIEEGQ